MGNRRACVAAGLIAVGWAVALAGEVVSARTDRAAVWLRDRELRADKADVTTFDRLMASSWPSYVASGVLAGYAGMVLLGTGRTGRHRGVAAGLCGVGLALAGSRLGGDVAWSLWEVVVGDGMSVVGYMLGLGVAAWPGRGPGRPANGPARATATSSATG